MRRLEDLKKMIAALSAEELSAFRKWFAELDAAAWDAQIEADARAGKLDDLADEALSDRKSGKCSDL